LHARIYLFYLDPDLDLARSRAGSIENAMLAAGARRSGKRKKQKKKRGTGAMSSSRPHSQTVQRSFVRSFVRYAPLN